MVFIGPPASGKSKIGREVARILELPFVDTDKVVVAEHGEIPEIFATRGEPWFREREREAVEKALREPGVVSLGGGAVVNADTREQLVDLPVVLLEISEEAVAPRVTDSPKRPLLNGLDSWRALVDARRDWYDECATHRVDVSHRHYDEVAAEIVEWLTRQDGQHEH